jgi:hypothetical protein
MNRRALLGALVALLCACSAPRDAVPSPRAVLWLFADPECPISNAYAPELARLHAEFAPRGVEFLLVYADPSRTHAELAAHHAAFGYPFGFHADADQALTTRAGATTTPEACLFLPDGSLAYRGRIDDRYVDFGKQRAAPTRRDLRDAIATVLASKRPPEPWPRPIGCPIPIVDAADPRGR